MEKLRNDNNLYDFQAAIWHCLNHYAYSDAIFLAERLHAEGKFPASGFYVTHFVGRSFVYVLEVEHALMVWMCLFDSSEFGRHSLFASNVLL